MINFLRKHKHLDAMLAPVILGLIFIALCLPAVNRPITFHEADALMNIFHSHARGLRIVAIIIMCLILVVMFHVVKHIGGFKIATIASAVTVAVFTAGVYLKNIPTHQEVALANIIVDVRQFDPEPQTIYFDIPNFNAALFYNTSDYPVAELVSRPTGEHHFWLVVPLENTEALQLPPGYYISHQLGNDYYAAVDLAPTDN